MNDIQYVREEIHDILRFQQKKLATPAKNWEEAMRMRIQDKIAGLELADEILKAFQQGRLIIVPEPMPTGPVVLHKVYNPETKSWDDYPLAQL